MPLDESVSNALSGTVSARGMDWYRERRAFLENAKVDEVRMAFTAARRWLGTDPVNLSLPGCWRADIAGRLGLLLAGLPALTESTQIELVQGLYLRGELEERRAVLRALPYLPSRELHLPLAIEACRTNAKDMFEAIACENEYPSAEFPALAFHQMVLKALFMNLHAERIVGLSPRIDAELLRMLGDFEAELVAAGRQRPSGMAWIRERAARS